MPKETSKSKEKASIQKDKRKNSSFLRACANLSVEKTPVWLMRQAGRYMPEYRAIRDKTDFLSLCKDSDLCSEVTVFAQEKIKADAAIIFSDLLLIVEPLGLKLEYLKSGGPQISKTISTAEDVSKLPKNNVASSLGFVYEAIQKTRQSLKEEIPLIGFAGCPFTLASYMIEGGASRNFKKTKCFMYNQPEAWHLLLNLLASALAEYLLEQVAAGVDALQLFDSWVSCLSPSDYREYVLPHSRTLISKVDSAGVPIIHFGTGTGSFLKEFKSAGGDVIGVDFHIDIAEADRLLGADVAIQGNLDPLVLFSSVKEIRKKVKAILDPMANRPGYIFNLGHGILPETPVENVGALIAMVHEVGARS